MSKKLLKSTCMSNRYINYICTDSAGLNVTDLGDERIGQLKGNLHGENIT